MSKGMDGFRDWTPPTSRGEGEQAMPRGLRRAPSMDPAVTAPLPKPKKEGRIKGVRVCYVDPEIRQILEPAVIAVLSEDARKRLERFDSTKEANRYLELLQLRDAGRIVDLTRQVAFPLNVKRADRQTETISRYVCDFEYREVGDRGVLRRVVEDVKGPYSRTAVYALKKRHFQAQYGVEIRET